MGRPDEHGPAGAPTGPRGRAGRRPSAGAVRELALSVRGLLAALALPGSAFGDGERRGYMLEARDRVRAALGAIGEELRARPPRPDRVPDDGWPIGACGRLLAADGWPEVALRALEEVDELFGELDAGWRAEDERSAEESRRYHEGLAELDLRPGAPLPGPPAPAAPTIEGSDRLRLGCAAELLGLEVGLTPPPGGPPGPPRAGSARPMGPADERNRWLYGLARQGLGYPEIAARLRAEVARHPGGRPGWKVVGEQGVRDAIRAHVTKFEIEPPAPRRRNKKNQGKTP